MHSNLLVKQAASISAFFLAVFTIACSLVGLEKGAVIFLGLLAVPVVMVLIKITFYPKPLYPAFMYILVMTTFLNQSLLSIDVGFFHLFLYRIVLIVTAVFFISHVMAERNLSHYWNQTNVKGVLLFLLFWLVYGFLSLLWAKSMIEGVKALFLLGLGILFVFLAVFTFKKMTDLFCFYGIWLLMTIILLAMGLINHFTGIQLPTSTLYGAAEYKRFYPTAVFFNQNDLAVFLTISFFFYIALTKNSRQVWLQTVSLLLACFCVVTIYWTESRASLLGIGAGLLTYFFILLPKFLKKITAIAGTASLLFVLMAFSGKIFNKITSLINASDTYWGNEVLPSNLARINLLKNTIHYFADTFGFGVGAGNIPFYLKNEPIYATNHVVEVHNWLAEIMGNYGILILLGYVTMYAFLFFRLYQFYQWQISQKYKVLLEAGMMGMAGFLVSSISPSSVSNLFFHWVFLGFIISMVSVFAGTEHELREIPAKEKVSNA
ncbi:teichuronic acid biosynthesis protein TuaE [Neobacillus mesonae]|uniref:teichuronic acid biosynthesis protein TuaE n=1 Tax=Neobacillus mesonae TaxID=1193713 RepID=UPI00203B9EB5|nr:O-antigen ligase family protein [Neobacillus mesonae]MCM3571133.1 O-antigen ligase family protein [Neobacillus mesonae]